MIISDRSLKEFINLQGDINMKKTFELEDLDCANCAMKMQEAILKIPGVKGCEVNFIKQKMTLEADDAEFDKIVKLAVKAIAKVEPDCTVLL